MEPLVSIIVLNNESLDSVLLQKYRNLQILLCTDDLFDDPRILKIGAHSTIIESINKALQNAKGKYVHIICNGDVLYPMFLSKCVEILEKDDQLSFVQTGTMNIPCGKMSKYLYLAYITDDLIKLSSYVFKNKMKQSFENDVLFVLDNLDKYCYYLYEQLCKVSGHHIKKGIELYFKEHACHFLIEVHKYVDTNLSYGSENHEILVDICIRLIEKYDLSLYEIKKVLFSHDRYNIDIQDIPNVMDLGEPISQTKIDKYLEISKQFYLHFDTVPTYSIIKYLNDRNIDVYSFDPNDYTKYLYDKLGINYNSMVLPLDTIEQILINTNEYNDIWFPTFRKVVKYYLNDFKMRRIKKIALALISSHLKYLSLWKVFEDNVKAKSCFDKTNSHLFVHYLLRRYHYDEINNHLVKDQTTFEKELIFCEEFNTLHQTSIQELADNYNTFIDIKRKLWDMYAIPFSYSHCMRIANSPEKEWDNIICNILDYSTEYYMYTRMRDFYQLNEIFGEDIKCAFQICGHLRYYKELHHSLKNVSRYANCDTFIFTWSDSMGIRNNVFTRENITKEIFHMKVLFNPVSLEYEDNTEYLHKNLIPRTFFTLETKYCSYPQVKSQLYTIWKTNELRKKHENSKKIKYDIVFKLRMDALIGDCFCTESLFHIYYTTNYHNFIYVSHDKDHTHVDGTGCNTCNRNYWTYFNLHKHSGEHSNDICDFIAITSASIMNNYCSLYLEFEKFYTQNNDDICNRLYILEKRGKIRNDVFNKNIPMYLRHIYKHFIVESDEISEEFRFISKTPFYPEAWLKIFLKDYIVISNRYFRIFFREQ
jgi:hypothetical protein